MSFLCVKRRNAFLSGRPVLVHQAPHKQAQHPLTPELALFPRHELGLLMACRLLLTAVLSLAFANQVFANWWIVRSSDEKCLVVDIEPMTNNKAVTKVGKDVCQTPEQAEADVELLCKDQLSNIVLRRARKR